MLTNDFLLFWRAGIKGAFVCVLRRFTFHNYREGRQYSVDLQMLLTDIRRIIDLRNNWAHMQINNLKETNWSGNEFLKVYFIIKKIAEITMKKFAVIFRLNVFDK